LGKKLFFWTDRRMYERTYWRTFQTPLFCY